MNTQRFSHNLVFATVTLLCLAIVLLLSNGAPAAASPTAPAELAAPFSAAVCAPADGAFTITRQSHIGGDTMMAAVQGNYAYVVQGLTLVVLDLSGATIHQVAFLPLPQEPRAMAVSGAYAYFLLRAEKGFVVVDISDPLHPALRGQVLLAAGTETDGAVAVQNGYAYVAAVSTGLHVVDVRNPAAPAFVRTLPGNALDVAVAGSYTYLATGSKLAALSLADPAFPRAVGETPVAARQVRAAGQYAYVADASNTTPGLRVFDLANPAAPRAAAFFPTTAASGVAYPRLIDVAGGRAYIVAYRGSENLLIVANVANPLAPVELGRMAASGWINSLGATATRGYLAIRASAAGFQEIDPAPATTAAAVAGPVVARDYRAPWDLTWLHLDENTLYAASDDGLWVYNVDDLAQPALVRHYPQWTRLMQTVVAGSPRLLYALAPTNMPAAGSLLILNATEPANLTQRGLFTPPGVFAQGLAVRGNYAYLLTGLPPRRFQVVNVANPAAPALASELILPNIGRTLNAGTGAVVYAGYGDLTPTGPGGVAVIDVSNPAAPRIVRTVALTGAPAALSVEGNRLAVGSNAATGWRVELYDITNPAAPIPVAHNARTGTGQVWSVELRDGVLFVGAQGQTVFALWPSPTGLDPLASLASPSTIEFITNYMSGAGTYGYGAGFSAEGYRGMEGEFVNWVSGSLGFDGYSVGVPSSCGVIGTVKPSAAATAGCWIKPTSQSCKCGDPESKIKFEAAADCKGWVFTGFSNTNPLPCPASGVAEQVANYDPYLYVTGGGKTDLCLSAEEAERKNLTALSFQVCASEADNWEVTKLGFQASGSGNDQSEIDKVQLQHRGAEIGGVQTYPADNGKVSFSFPKIIITSGGCEPFTLLYDLKALGTCTAPQKEFNVQHSLADLSAKPVSVGGGLKMGAPSGGVVAACVWNQTTHTGYDLIQPAVDGAADGQTIGVCAGEYTENVNVTKALTIHSFKGRDKTYVTAASANDHVFEVIASNATIQGFTARDATGVRRAGVFLGAVLAAGDATAPTPGLGAPTAATGVSNCKVLGNALQGNSWGVLLDGATNNQIGGDTASAGNVISGNHFGGVLIFGSRTTTNKVLGNHIGADASGEQKSPNSGQGVYLVEAPGNLIQGNLISGNKAEGVRIEGSSARGNTVQDNIIGANAWANRVLGNERDGVRIDGAPGNIIKGNVIGGNGTFDIPDMDAGVKIVGVRATGNLVQGNSIGVDTTGTIDLANQGSGVLIDGAPGNFVGGATDGEGNLISKNRGNGIRIDGEAASGNQLRRNQIGTNRAGTTAMKNHRGVFITDAPGTIIEDNLISGNVDEGIYIRGEKVDDTQVRRNWLGVTLAGDTKLPNQRGIQIEEGASHTTISNNLISGNEYVGVAVGRASWTWIQGNRIGTDASGTVKLSNGGDGIGLSQEAINTVIGSLYQTAPPKSCTGACNLISGNAGNGVGMSGRDTTVSGNYIGTTISGNAALGNTGFGVYGHTRDAQIIQSNVIADNGKDGINVSSYGRIEVAGNYVGVGANGATALSNEESGISILGSNTSIHGNRIWHQGINLDAKFAKVYHNSAKAADEPKGWGIYCNGSQLSGNEIIGNKEGIVQAYATCQAHRNNIQGNSPYGASGVIDAIYSWWGAANGPSGEGPGLGDMVSSGVSYDPWLTTSVTVDVEPGGTVKGPPGGAFTADSQGGLLTASAGGAASGRIYFQNWAHVADTLQVTVTDSRGWLIPPGSFAVPISDGVGGSAVVSFTIPAGTLPGTSSTVTVTAISGAAPADSAVSAFQVIAALPADLELDMTSDVNSAISGQPIRYTLHVANTGPNPISRGVATALLPAEMHIVSTSPSQGTCTAEDRRAVCDLGGLGVDAAATVDVSVRMAIQVDVSDIIGVAWVEVMEDSRYDPDLADNGDSATVIIAPSARLYLPLMLRLRS